MGVTYDNNGRLHQVVNTCDEVQDVVDTSNPERSLEIVNVSL